MFPLSFGHSPPTKAAETVLGLGDAGPPFLLQNHPASFRGKDRKHHDFTELVSSKKETI